MSRPRPTKADREVRRIAEEEGFEYLDLDLTRKHRHMLVGNKGQRVTVVYPGTTSDNHRSRKNIRAFLRRARRTIDGGDDHG